MTHNAPSNNFTETEYKEFLQDAHGLNVSDDENYAFILSNVSTDLVRQIALGKIDMVKLASMTLRSRRA